MRLHYFDNGKALASILGIFYHAGLIFTVPWLINVPTESFNQGIGIFTFFSNLFRMPLFMFIAGYFAIYSVFKYSFQDFLKNKLQRLGLPLITSLLTLVFIQTIYSEVFFKKNLSINEAIHRIFPWDHNFTLSHLWFLYLVLLFSLILYLVVYHLKSAESIFNKFKTAQLNLNGFTIDFILIMFILLSSVSFYIIELAFPIRHALLPFAAFGNYLPYFLMGILLHNNYNKYSVIFLSYSNKRLLIIASITTLAIITLNYFNNYDSLVLQALTYFLKTVSNYYTLLIVLFILNKYLNSTNKVLRYLSDSSYSVYLLHQPIITIAAYYYIKYVNHYSFTSYLTLVLIAVLITYSIDFLVVRKTTIGKYLYTGVKTK